MVSSGEKQLKGRNSSIKKSDGRLNFATTVKAAHPTKGIKYVPITDETNQMLEIVRHVAK